MTINFHETIYHSPFGSIFLRADDDALLELHFVSSEPANSSSLANINFHQHPILAQTAAWLDQYFAGQKHSPNSHPPLRLNLTPFNVRVLEIASQVPFGQTMTYGEIAEIIAAERNLFKMSAQAVGSAMRKNPICLIVPCHRIIGANGHLGGYNGEPARKRQLLAHEGIDTTRLV